MLKKIIALALLILIGSNIYAISESNHVIEHISFTEGLNMREIISITSDKEGYIWFNSVNDIYRYDGKHLISIINSHPTINSEKLEAINNIFIDSKNNFYVASQGEMYVFDKENFSLTEFNNHGHTELNNIYAIDEDKDGNLWLIGKSGWLFKVSSKGYIEKYNLEQNRQESKTENFYTSLVVAVNGNIVCSTFDGRIVTFNTATKTTSNYQIPPNKHTPSALPSIQKLKMCSDSSIYICERTSGLFKYNPINGSAVELINFNTNSQKNMVSDVTMDQERNLWLATNDGILLWNEQTKEQKWFTSKNNSENSLSSNYCRSLLFIKPNIVLAGTYNGGVNKINILPHYFKADFPEINNVDDQKIKFVKCIWQTDDGYIYLSNDYGLSKYSSDRKFIKIYKQNIDDQKSIGIGAVTSFYQQNNSTIWLGMWGSSLVKFDLKNETFKSYFRAEPRENAILDMIKANDSLLFCATHGGGVGVFNLNTDTFEFLKSNKSDSNSLIFNEVFDILADDIGNVYIGTIKGLSVYNILEKTFTNYTQSKNGLIHNSILCLYKSRDNNIWIGTERGVSIFNPNNKTFADFRSKDGLQNQSIGAIIQDNNGDVWLSSTNALIRYKTKKQTITFFTPKEGAITNARYAFKMNDGQLAFTGINGVLIFNPNNIPDNTIIKPIILSNLYINNQLTIPNPGSVLKTLLSNTQSLTLRHDQATFSIEFNMLDYNYPNKNKYSYILEGNDKDRNWIGENTTAHYTNIKPGTYKFIVKATNSFGYTNEEGVVLDIKILPPWYLTLLAKVFYFVFISVAIFAFFQILLYRQQANSQLEHERILAKKNNEVYKSKIAFFLNISHELRTPVTLIINPLEKLLGNPTTPPLFRQSLRTAYNNANKLLKIINQTLDFRHIENESLTLKMIKADLNLFVETITENFQMHAKSKKINLVYTAPNKPLICRFDPDNFEKISGNIINNAIKYSFEDSEIYVTLSHIDSEDQLPEIFKSIKDLLPKELHHYILSVKDTGMGIKEDDIDKIFTRFFRTNSIENSNISGVGIGLALVKDLVELHEGFIKVESTYGTGSTFYVLMPKKYQKSEQIEISKEKFHHQQTKKQNLEPSSIEIIIPENNPTAPLVFVVEDEPELKHIIADILSQDYRVMAVSSAEQALELLETSTPEIIISDIMMEGMSGLELCAKLKAGIKTSHIPIIFVTAKAMEQNIIDGFKTGADDYIVKPFNGNILLARVKNLINAKAQIKSSYVRDLKPELKDLVNSNYDELFLEKAIKITEQYIDNDDFDSNKFAEEMGVSRSLLYTKLKVLTGQTVNDFIKNIRLKRAAWMIINTQLTVSEIAYSVGFKNLSYFTKCFKELFGVLPSKYIETQK